MDLDRNHQPFGKGTFRRETASVSLSDPVQRSCDESGRLQHDIGPFKDDHGASFHEFRGEVDIIGGADDIEIIDPITSNRGTDGIVQVRGEILSRTRLDENFM